MKRPSKVDTLRTAINYIRCLQDVLADDDRQRMSTFQTFETAAAAADTAVISVCPHHWKTSPAAVAGHDSSCSPLTSLPSSPSDDLTTTMTAINDPDFADETLDRHVVMSPLASDILDWLV